MKDINVLAGVYSNSYDAALNVKNGFPVFNTIIEANFIGKQEDQYAAFKLTDEDRQDIHRLARDPNIGACDFSDLHNFISIAQHVCCNRRRTAVRGVCLQYMSLPYMKT